MYKRYRENIPIGYAGTSVSPVRQKNDPDITFSEKKEVFPMSSYTYPKKNTGRGENISASLPRDKEPYAALPALSADGDMERECFEEHFSEDTCQKKDPGCSECPVNGCKRGDKDEKSKSEGFLGNIFGEKFSLEDLIFMGILILLVTSKADDEIMLIIGLLLLVSL